MGEMFNVKRWPVVYEAPRIKGSVWSEPDISSGYGDRRANGVVHWGVDIPGDAHDPIVAPETLQVVKVEAGSGTSTTLPPPLNGYGPGAIVALGESGVWHLLAHQDPGFWREEHMPTVGEIYLEGEQLGRMPLAVGAAGPHVHWEVRTHKPYDSPPTREANTIDPVVWARAGEHGNRAGVRSYHGGDWQDAEAVFMKRYKPAGLISIPWWVWVLGLYYWRRREAR